MKNNLMDLNDHMFAQMDRLSKENLEGDDLNREITRSKAISSLAVQIINNAKLCLDARKSLNEGSIKTAPKMLGMEPLEEI